LGAKATCNKKTLPFAHPVGCKAGDQEAMVSLPCFGTLNLDGKNAHDSIRDDKERESLPLHLPCPCLVAFQCGRFLLILARSKLEMCRIYPPSSSCVQQINQVMSLDEI
jgi:hypothetical protein